VAGVGISNNDAVKKLKGKRGTKVDVGIKRSGEPELLDFTIIRDIIPTYSVDIAYMVDDSVGYIKVSKFSATTYEEFSKAMDDLTGQGMTRLILDLRGNYGGLLDACIRMSDEFLPDGKLIVYTEGNSRPNDYAYASGRGIFEANPMVVLIDEGSASASEIVAGAVQDNDRGLIIGRRSFGKGLVQEQLNLPDGSALRLTVARYHTPTGRNIQRPYEKGNDEYYSDYYHRFADGEMFNKDSVYLNDSLKYVTPGGKVVYGGGGIMPDIYIPIANEEEDWYFNQLVRKNILFQFAFDYTDTHRAELSEYQTAKAFADEFTIPPALFGKLTDYAREQGVDATGKQIRDSKTKTEVLMKAYIARNLFSDKGFYPVYHAIDDTFQRGYKELTQ
jgi:carboxyl-terminal processing protease